MRNPSATTNIDFRNIGTTVETAIRGLPDGWRSALILTAVDDLTTTEAADLLNVSVPTLSARAASAHLRLLQDVAAKCDVTPDSPLLHDIVQSVVARLANPPAATSQPYSWHRRVRDRAHALWSTWTTVVTLRPALPLAATAALILLVGVTAVPGILDDRRATSMLRPPPSADGPPPLLMEGWIPSAVPPANRLALAIGNSAYSTTRLPTPGNDATDVAAALSRLGFLVETVLDGDAETMADALNTLTRRSAGADVALVYYAGHGVEWEGNSYLVPVDGEWDAVNSPGPATVPVRDVLMATAGASLRLVILDACQPHVAPAAVGLPQTGSSGRSCVAAETQRLPANMLVAYAATSAPTTAAQQHRRNSPYATALLAHLEAPLAVSEMFRRVRARVTEMAGERQRPYELVSLRRPYYLTATSPDAASSRAP